jgi:hypothetical protein
VAAAAGGARAAVAGSVFIIFISSISFISFLLPLPLPFLFGCRRSARALLPLPVLVPVVRCSRRRAADQVDGNGTRVGPEGGGGRRAAAAAAG